MRKLSKTIDYLRSHPDASNTDVIRECGVSRGTVNLARQKTGFKSSWPSPKLDAARAYLKKHPSASSTEVSRECNTGPWVVCRARQKTGIKSSWPSPKLGAALAYLKKHPSASNAKVVGECGVSRGTVNLARQKTGIKNHNTTRYHPDTEQRINIINHAISAKAAGDKIGVSRERVRQIIQKHGLTHPKERQEEARRKKQEEAKSAEQQRRTLRCLKTKFAHWIFLIIPKKNPLQSCWGWQGPISSTTDRKYRIPITRTGKITMSAAKLLIQDCRPEIAPNRTRIICETPHCLNPWHREPRSCLSNKNED